jgi:Recombination endonuclease VII
MPRERTSHCGACGAAKVLLKSGASRCLTCHNRWGREYYHKSRLRRQKQQAAYVLRKYGLSMDLLEAMLGAQNGRCAICRKGWAECKAAKRVQHEAMFLHYLYVDHDHQSGRVRGLLCNACNTAIGLFEEDPARIGAAAAYLSEEG